MKDLNIKMGRTDMILDETTIHKILNIMHIGNYRSKLGLQQWANVIPHK